MHAHTLEMLHSLSGLYRPPNPSQDISGSTELRAESGLGGVSQVIPAPPFPQVWVSRVLGSYAGLPCGSPKCQPSPDRQESPLEHRSLNFLTPATCYVEDDFSTYRREGGGFGMIEVHCVYCALSFYNYCIVIHREIIIQLSIMQKQWET